MACFYSNSIQTSDVTCDISVYRIQIECNDSGLGYMEPSTSASTQTCMCKYWHPDSSTLILQVFFIVYDAEI